MVFDIDGSSSFLAVFGRRSGSLVFKHGGKRSSYHIRFAVQCDADSR